MKRTKKMTGVVLTAAMIAGMTMSTGVYAQDTETDSENTVISEEEANLTMMSYYDGENDELNNYAYEKVKEAFPNVTIEFESEPQDGGQTIKTRAATGDLPDIMLADSGTISILAESGSILQLDDYIEELNYEDKLVQGAIQTCLTSLTDIFMSSQSVGYPRFCGITIKLFLKKIILRYQRITMNSLRQ